MDCKTILFLIFIVFPFVTFFFLCFLSGIPIGKQYRIVKELSDGYYTYYPQRKMIIFGWSYVSDDPDGGAYTVKFDAESKARQWINEQLQPDEVVYQTNKIGEEIV